LSTAGGKLYVADTNNHAIRVFDPASGDLATLRIDV
jgi:DNA-binding beta-propeller fold protein YncE